MADLHDDDHFFEDMSPESPGTIERNIVRRLGLASQVAEAIRSPSNNIIQSNKLYGSCRKFSTQNKTTSCIS